MAWTIDDFDINGVTDLATITRRRARVDISAANSSNPSADFSFSLYVHFDELNPSTRVLRKLQLGSQEVEIRDYTKLAVMNVEFVVREFLERSIFMHFPNASSTLVDSLLENYVRKFLRLLGKYHIRYHY